MGQTIAQKIIAAHLVSGEMKAGAEIALKIDQTLTQDATGTMAYLEFESMGIPFTGLLLLMGNVTFVIYDVAVARIIGLYCARFRARLMKMH